MDATWKSFPTRATMGRYYTKKGILIRSPAEELGKRISRKHCLAVSQC